MLTFWVSGPFLRKWILWVMPLRKKWAGCYWVFFAERQLGTGVSVWILCSQRGVQPLPVGIANAALIKIFCECLISSELVFLLKRPLVGVEADVGNTSDWQVQIEFSVRWDNLLRHVKKRSTFHRKIKKILKFHIGDNAVPYKSSEFLLPCYLVTMRESAEFIFKFKLFCGLNSGGKNPEEYDNQSGI